MCEKLLKASQADLESSTEPIYRGTLDDSLSVSPRMPLVAAAWNSLSAHDRRWIEQRWTNGPTNSPAQDVSAGDAQNAQAVVDLLARLYVSGAELDWPAIDALSLGRRVPLPFSPWDQQSYWHHANDQLATNVPSDARTDTNLVDRTWINQAVWEPLEDDAPATHAIQTWVVVGQPTKRLQQWIEQACSTGHRVVAAQPTSSPGESGDAVTWELEDSALFATLLDNLDLSPDTQLGVVHWHSEDQPANLIQPSGCQQLLAVVQELARRRSAVPTTLYVVTHGAAAVRDPSECVAPAAAALAGMARVVARELAAWQVRWLDLAPHDADVSWWQELTSSNPEPEVAYRAGQRFVLRRRPLEAALTAITPSPLRQGGVYLITGGLGGIGLQLATWLTRCYQAKVALLGRTPLPDESRWTETLQNPETPRQLCTAIDTIERLRAAGAQFVTYAADVTDQTALRQIVADVRQRWGNLHGVFHAAGTSRRQRIVETDWKQFAQVLKPKLAGSWALHEALKHESLDFVVLFSSIAGLEGNLFQADYSAANRFLDAWAAWRTATGKRTLAVAWGPWAEVGMAARLLERDAWRADDALEPAMACNTLEHLLRLSVHQAIVARPAPSPANIAARPVPWAEPATSVSEITVAVEDLLWRLLSATMNLPVDQLDRRTSFLDFGLDSMLAVRLVRALESALGQKFSVTLPFDYPNIRALATYLVERLHANQLTTGLGSESSEPCAESAPTDGNGSIVYRDRADQHAVDDRASQPSGGLQLKTGRRVVELRRRDA